MKDLLGVRDMLLLGSLLIMASFLLTGRAYVFADEDCFDTDECSGISQTCPPCERGLCGIEMVPVGSHYWVTDGTEYDEAEMTGPPDVCFKWRLCEKTGNECPEDPHGDECASGTGSFTFVYSGSGHLAIGECDN